MCRAARRRRLLDGALRLYAGLRGGRAAADPLLHTQRLHDSALQRRRVQPAADGAVADPRELVRRARRIVAGDEPLPATPRRPRRLPGARPPRLLPVPVCTVLSPRFPK